MERAFDHLKNVLFGMRIPRKRKPQQEIELEEACSKKLKFTREEIDQADAKTLYEKLKGIAEDQTMVHQQTPQEELHKILVSLLERVIQEEKYPICAIFFILFNNTRYAKEILKEIPDEIKMKFPTLFVETWKETSGSKLLAQILDSSTLSFIKDVAALLEIKCDSDLELVARYGKVAVISL